MRKLLGDPAAEPPADARAALAGVMPGAVPSPQYRVRPKAGMGSLGRPRYVALAEWAGGWVAREAKAAAPPATAWAAGKPGVNRMAEAVAGAVRAPDPFYCPGPAWVVRRLAPRCSRIELSPLAATDEGHVLHGMGAETANVHLGSPGGDAIRKDLARRPAGWLEEAAKAFAKRVEQDWEDWRAKAKG